MGFIPFLSLISVCQLHTSPSNRGHSTSKEAAKDSYVHKSEDSWLYGFLPLFKKYTACHKWTVDNIIPGYPQLSASYLVSRFIDLNSCKIRPTPSILWLLTLFKKESVCTWLHFPPVPNIHGVKQETQNTWMLMNNSSPWEKAIWYWPNTTLSHQSAFFKLILGKSTSFRRANTRQFWFASLKGLQVGKSIQSQSDISVSLSQLCLACII